MKLSIKKLFPDRDAIITLNDFTGKLYIRHASSPNITTASTTKSNIDDATPSNEDQNNQQSTPQDNH